MDNRKYLLGMTIEELRLEVKGMGMPGYIADQIASWVYVKRVTDIAMMTNISLKNRELLAAKFEVGRTAPSMEQRSVDGTVKYLFKVGENAYVESVYIPDDDRATLCVSSQVGCKMNCHFCMTAKQGFAMNLNTNQILNQIYSIPESETLTNIVFMGMGEPFDNLDAVLGAIHVMTASYGLAWSPKRITVSTVGLEKGFRRFLKECDCHLAVSLHTPIPAQRAQLMPAEKAFSIEKIVELLREYDFSKQRRLSFEYIMFKGVNDSEHHARSLLRLLRNLPCRINLIRFHAIPGVELQGTDEKDIMAFRDYLTSHGLFTTVRASRGEDIFAACGMLSTSEKNKNKNV